MISWRPARFGYHRHFGSADDVLWLKDKILHALATHCLSVYLQST